LQLVFYALLASQHPRFSQYQDTTGQMVYLEAESQKQLTRSFTPSKDDIGRLKQLIIAVWQHIMDLNFPDTSHYPQTIDGIKAFEQDLLDGRAPK
jgi:hypothetical protein